MQRTQIAAMTIATLLAASCGASKSMMPASEAERSASSADVSATGEDAMDGENKPVAGLRSFVRGNNAFAFDLYRVVRRDQFVLSPQAIIGELALLHAATTGEAQQQVARTLRFATPERDLQDRYRLLSDAVAGRLAPPPDGRPLLFKQVLGLWHAESLSPTTAFLQTAVNQHTANVQALDLAAKSAPDTINHYYDDATSGRIGKLLPEPLPSARVLLTSSATIDGPWAMPFQRALTKDRAFASPSGEVHVATMHSRMRVAHLDGDGFGLIELPYASGRVSAWVLLPDADQPDFDATLTADHFTWMTGAAKQRDVDVQLPRFEVQTRSQLRDVLATMGMPDVFTSASAQLTAFTPPLDLGVDDVVQAARLKVDEDGSEAAAATGSAPSINSGALPEFHVNRPFVVIIRDNPTGSILMMARISKP